MSSRDASDVDLKTSQREFRNALDEFRENWQRELQEQESKEPNIGEANVVHNEEISADVFSNDEDRLQAQAEALYRTAVELEQRGKVYDALSYYRKAMQIVPDIEFKFNESQTDVMKKYHNLPNEFNKQLDINKSDGTEEAGDELLGDIYEKFQNDLCADIYGGRTIMSSRDANVLMTGLHISDLPPEIMMRILRWVVSSQLDMRSLEQCSAVCKGFYVYARDEELWRLACLKVWGHNLGTLMSADDDGCSDNGSGYYSWRDMYLRRERVLFNGCYISKTTYLRMGENSFQDQFYRPVQLVEYYRYIRFLPDGKVLMMTSADEPAQGVSKLKQLQNIRPDILRGRYRLYGDTVTLVLQKAHGKQQQQAMQQAYIRKRRGSILMADEDANNIQYLIEFRIMHSPKRRYAQLMWSHYSLVQKRNKVESTSEFEITSNKYPPLWFSPVRSYHLNADAPLA